MLNSKSSKSAWKSTLPQIVPYIRYAKNFMIFAFVHPFQRIDQVCFEEMVPPTRIFQCKNGHLICEPCKYNSILHFSSNAKTVIDKDSSYQGRLEAMHLPKMQAKSYWTSNRYGGVLEVHLSLVLILCYTCSKVKDSRKSNIFTGASSEGRDRST